MQERASAEFKVYRTRFYMSLIGASAQSFFCLIVSYKPDLTHYRPVMPFGNRKICFRVSFQFSIVTIKKKISTLWKPEIQQYRHFSKRKIPFFWGGREKINFS